MSRRLPLLPVVFLLACGGSSSDPPRGDAGTDGDVVYPTSPDYDAHTPPSPGADAGASDGATISVPIPFGNDAGGAQLRIETVCEIAQRTNPMLTCGGPPPPPPVPNTGPATVAQVIPFSGNGGGGGVSPALLRPAQPRPECTGVNCDDLVAGAYAPPFANSWVGGYSCMTGVGGSGVPYAQPCNSIDGDEDMNVRNDYLDDGQDALGFDINTNDTGMCAPGSTWTLTLTASTRFVYNWYVDDSDAFPNGVHANAAFQFTIYDFDNSSTPMASQNFTIFDSGNIAGAFSTAGYATPTHETLTTPPSITIPVTCGHQYRVWFGVLIASNYEGLNDQGGYGQIMTAELDALSYQYKFVGQ